MELVIDPNCDPQILEEVRAAMRATGADWTERIDDFWCEPVHLDAFFGDFSYGNIADALSKVTVDADGTIRYCGLTAEDVDRQLREEFD